jgi:hypothetical protein
MQPERRQRHGSLDSDHPEGRAPCLATKRLGSAETKSESAITVSANMKLGTVKRDPPRSAVARQEIREFIARPPAA